MAYWYLAHEDELLIDLDNAARPTRNGAPWLEMFFRRRLREAIAGEKLDVLGVWLAPSTSERHYHAAVHLARPMPAIARLVWQLHLGSDLYRGRADLMRAARGFDAPSLLIRSAPMPEFYRKADHVCLCNTKHVTSENPACDVWRRFRGMSPWELFGKSEPGAVERTIGLRVGRVALDRIMAREAPGGDNGRSNPAGNARSDVGGARR